jgi:hypothetical protein
MASRPVVPSAVQALAAVACEVAANIEYAKPYVL